MVTDPAHPALEETAVVGRRIGAQVVDFVIAVGLIVVAIAGSNLLFEAVYGLAGPGELSDVAFMLKWQFFVLCLMAATFNTFFAEAAWSGQTVGKKLFGVKVVTTHGEECDYWQAILRNVLEIVDGIALFLVASVFMARSEYRQRIGDRAAGTVVVRA